MKHTLLKRAISLLLVCALLFSISTAVLGYTTSAWAKKEIDAAAQAGIIPDSMMDQNLSTRLTREEMCDIVVHTYEKMTGTTLYPSTLTHFSDTYSINVNIAADLGIVNGSTDGKFWPDNTITRQEFAQIVSNFYTALGWTVADMNPAEPEPDPEPTPEPDPEPTPEPDPDIPAASDFEDYDTVSRWAKAAADTVVGLGIIKGTNNQLMPLNTTSREEALIMMLRSYKYMMNHLGLPLPTGNTVAAETTADPEAPLQATSPSYHCSNWAKTELAEAVSYGIIPASLLSADLTQQITREEICYSSVLCFMAITDTAGDPESTDHFTDTNDPMINLAFELGLVRGTPGGTFMPYELMNREQLFVIITNLLQVTGWQAPAAVPATAASETAPALDTANRAVDLTEVFNDAAEISRWAQSAVSLMYEVGIIKGDAYGNMHPLSPTSREEGIVMFLRAYQYIQPWYNKNPITSLQGPTQIDEDVKDLILFAMQFEGYPYVWAGQSPAGFDCSGFIWYIYKDAGYSVNRTAASLTKNGTHVEYNQLRPGDIICFWNNAHTEIGHVGLYIGHGKIIHAQSSSTGVCVSDVTPGSYYYNRYYEARRIIT